MNDCHAVCQTVGEVCIGIRDERRMINGVRSWNLPMQIGCYTGTRVQLLTETAKYNGEIEF